MLHVKRVAVLLGLLLADASAAANDARDALWAAVRNGDADAIKTLLDKGGDVNAKNEMGISALWIAAGKKKLDVVQLLLERGADVNARDGIWYRTPLTTAVGDGNAEIVATLVRAGAKDVDAALIESAGMARLEIIRALLDSGRVSQDALDAALSLVPKSQTEVREALEKAGAKALRKPSDEERAAWQRLAGTFENENGAKMTIDLTEQGLAVRRGPSGGLVLKPLGNDAFSPLGMPEVTYAFERQGNKATRVIRKQFTAEYSFYLVDAKPIAKPTDQSFDEGKGAAVRPSNWPSFRGPQASGVADGQHLVATWDVRSGANVLWKTPIPGLGHSCPIIWGDRVFISTAVSGDPDPKIRIGNYGDVRSVDDKSKHVWQLLCLDRPTGAVLWTRTAHEGIPKIKRHLKGSQANCTPATDGQRVVVCFGSEGLYCYDFAGKLLWQRDLSMVDSSFQIDQEYEWGFGSSPVIHEGLVILQCDLSKDSFIAAFSLEDGSRVWLTPRDEIPSWSTPTVWLNPERVEIVTNAAQYARGYDPATGKELWRLAKKSEITVPTPVVTRDLAFITSGNRPIQPLFALRPGAEGDVSLDRNQDSNEHVAWSRMRGGPYMPTPIVYGDYLYTCGNGGMVTCYEAATGKEVYKERMGGSSYTASPLASDGRLYFTSEEGQVRVVRAGPKFELLAVNEMDDYCMATPAIASGVLFVRTQHHVVAIGRKPDAK